MESNQIKYFVKGFYKIINMLFFLPVILMVLIPFLIYAIPTSEFYLIHLGLPLTEKYFLYVFVSYWVGVFVLLFLIYFGIKISKFKIKYRIRWFIMEHFPLLFERWVIMRQPIKINKPTSDDLKNIKLVVVNRDHEYNKRLSCELHQFGMINILFFDEFYEDMVIEENPDLILFQFSTDNFERILNFVQTLQPPMNCRWFSFLISPIDSEKSKIIYKNLDTLVDHGLTGSIETTRPISWIAKEISEIGRIKSYWTVNGPGHNRINKFQHE